MTFFLAIVACKSGPGPGAGEAGDSGDRDDAHESASPHLESGRGDSGESDTDTDSDVDSDADSDTDTGGCYTHDTGDTATRDAYSPGPWLKVACGLYGTCCGIRADNSLACWGTYPEAPCGNDFRDVAVGAGWQCVVRSTGAIDCWGPEIPVWTAEGVDLTPPSGTYASVDDFYTWACALDATGTPTCWGETSGFTLPARATNMAVGAGGACFLDDIQDLECTGWTWDMHQAGPFAEVGMGAYTRAALRTDGSLALWPLRSVNDVCREDDVPGGSYSAFDMGYYYGCAIRAADGSLVCWGREDNCANRIHIHEYGQTRPPPDTGFVSVTVGAYGGCALDAAGGMTCWGYPRIARPPD